MIYRFVNDFKGFLMIFDDFWSFLVIFRGIHGCGGENTVQHNLILFILVSKVYFKGRNS